MVRKDPRIDTYIAQAAPFAQPILKHLRKIVHTGCPDVQETIKWSMPFFDHHGIMCGMAAFKRHCAFHFWKAPDTVGRDGKAEAKGMGQFGRITALSDLPADEVLIEYVREAAARKLSAQPTARVRAKAKPEPLIVPDDLKLALQNNAAARQTFDGFSPSQRKDYVEWITEAKRDATREQRLATTLEWLAEGKTRHWKHQRK